MSALRDGAKRNLARHWDGGWSAGQEANESQGLKGTSARTTRILHTQLPATKMVVWIASGRLSNELNPDMPSARRNTRTKPRTGVFHFTGAIAHSVALVPSAICRSRTRKGVGQTIPSKRSLGRPMRHQLTVLDWPHELCCVARQKHRCCLAQPLAQGSGDARPGRVIITQSLFFLLSRLLSN